MFRTYSDGELASMAVFCPGAKHWNLVELRGNIVRFMVSFVASQGDSEKLRRRTFLLSDICTLCDFLSQARSDGPAITVHALVPEAETWQLERLTDLLIGNEPHQQDQQAHVLRVASGSTTVLSAFGTLERDLLDLRSLFPIAA